MSHKIDWRLSDVPWKETEPEEFKDPDFRSTQKCTLFLAYTSNMISSGLRETIRYLVQNKMVRYFMHIFKYIHTSIAYILYTHKYIHTYIYMYIHTYSYIYFLYDCLS
jgi:hypothetical protein